MFIIVGSDNAENERNNSGALSTDVLTGNYLTNVQQYVNRGVFHYTCMCMYNHTIVLDHVQLACVISYYIIFCRNSNCCLCLWDIGAIDSHNSHHLRNLPVKVLGIKSFCLKLSTLLCANSDFSIFDIIIYLLQSF